jgi:predicted YcjX-like family ATPase
MSLFADLGGGLQRLAYAGVQAWPFATTTIRIGVTGLSRAGKTAFLTSAAANLMAKRWALAPVGAADLPRFDQARHLARLAADPPAWPERTDAASLLALTTSLPRGALPARHVRVEFLDYPGEWLIDLPMLTQTYAQWSQATLTRLRGLDMPTITAPFLAFADGLPARAAADESLAHAGTRLYRDMLAQLRVAGLAFLQPGRHLMPAPGPEAPWMSFFPSAATGPLATLLADRYAAYLAAVRRDLASPMFANVDRLVILADILTALHAGPAAFADMRQALSAAAGSLRWQFNWWEALGALAQFSLPPRLIERVAFAATKADHVAERQRGNLAALMRSLTEIPAGNIKTGHFAIASVRCTEDFVWTLDGRPVSAVRGRVLGQQVMTRSYPGEVPDRPPGPDFWEHPFLALPHFEPMRLPDGGRLGVPNVGLDALFAFLLEDVQ